MSGGVYLDLAAAEDIAALAELEASCFTHPWTRSQIADELASGPPGAVLVLRGVADGRSRLCAMCAYRVVIDEMHILDVAVAPERRRQGLARLLLRHALARAARAGAKIALLEVRSGNKEALALYVSLGFSRDGVRRLYYNEPAEDAILLSCKGLRGRAPGGREPC